MDDGRNSVEREGKKKRAMKKEKIREKMEEVLCYKFAINF